MSVAFDNQLADFLYWHAVSKMRTAAFADAEVLFRFLHGVCPERTDAAMGRLYCLARLGELEESKALVNMLRKQTLIPIEVALVGRLHRRCEFESARVLRERTANQQRPAVTSNEATPVRMPHTLGDDEMARLAAESL
jgi:hypothetical protein